MQLWFHALQHVDKNLFVHDAAKANLSLDVPSFVKKMVEIDPTMAFLTDNQDRKAMHMASTINKQAIQSVLLWHNRYQVDPEPEHISTTCKHSLITSSPYHLIYHTSLLFTPPSLTHAHSSLPSHLPLSHTTIIHHVHSPYSYIPSSIICLSRLCVQRKGSGRRVGRCEGRNQVDEI